jgi:hypothetical protein
VKLNVRLHEVQTFSQGDDDHVVLLIFADYSQGLALFAASSFLIVGVTYSLLKMSLGFSVVDFSALILFLHI